MDREATPDLLDEARDVQPHSMAARSPTVPPLNMRLLPAEVGTFEAQYAAHLARTGIIRSIPALDIQPLGPRGAGPSAGRGRTPGLSPFSGDNPREVHSTSAHPQWAENVQSGPVQHQHRGVRGQAPQQQPQQQQEPYHQEEQGQQQQQQQQFHTQPPPTTVATTREAPQLWQDDQQRHEPEGQQRDQAHVQPEVWERHSLASTSGTRCTFLRSLRNTEGRQLDADVIRTIVNMALILAILIAPRPTRAQTATVSEYTGAVNFDAVGVMAPGAETAVMMLQFDVRQLRVATDRFKGFHSMSMIKFPKKEDIRRAEQALQSLLDLTEFNDRSKRSFSTWMAGVLGLYNVFASKQIEDRVDHTIKAVRHTVHGVQALSNFSKVASEHITALETKAGEQRNMMQEIEVEQGAIAAWAHISATLTALSRVVELGLTHKASTAIQLITDIRDAWRDFSTRMEEAELRPVIESWQQLFQCHVDMALEEGKLLLAIVIPTTHQDTVWMALLRWRARPFLMNEAVVEINPQQRWLAVESESGATIPLNEEEYDRCTKIGNRVLCAGNLVQYTGGAGTCITALWATNWPEVIHRCPMTTRPMRTEAWPVQINEFAMTSPEGSVVIVQCPGKANQVLKIPPGMHLIKLPPHCSSTSAEWHSIVDVGEDVVRRVSYPIDMTLMVGSLTDRNETERKIETGEMSHPKPVVWKAEEAEQELQAAAPKKWLELTTLALAVAACVMIVALTLGSFLMAKFKAPRSTPIVE